jgi:hypothetical protein
LFKFKKTFTNRFTILFDAVNREEERAVKRRIKGSIIIKKSPPISC